MRTQLATPSPAAVASFRDWIDRLGGPSVIARELALPYQRVAKWRIRNTVPSPYWTDLLRLSENAGLSVSVPEVFALVKRR